MINSEAALAELPPEQAELYRSQPFWVTLVFGLAVIGGTLGAIGLVMRRRWAFGLLLASLIGVLAQDFYMFFLSDAIAVSGGPTAAIGPLFVLAIAIALIPWSRMGIQRGWLR